MDTSAFLNGLAGVFDSINTDFGVANPTIGGQITSALSGAANAAQGIHGVPLPGVHLIIIYLSLYSATDFQITAQSVTLSEAQTRACVTFTVTDDAVFDPNEVFDVNLATTTSFATVRSDRSSAVVIIDDDGGRELHQTYKREHL